MSAQLPSWLTENMVGQGTVQVDGVDHTYYVLRREAEPNLVGFVGIIGDEQSGRFIVISEDVPENYRMYVLWHEITELLNMDATAGACLATLKLELPTIPAEILIEYMQYRLGFMRRLLVYYADRDDRHANAVKSEVPASIEYLELMLAEGARFM